MVVTHIQKVFESATVGAWVQDTGDNGNWTVQTAGTPSGATGPSAASDLSYYIFTEASSGASPGSPNQTAFLNSPCFDLTGLSAPSFSFDYHMYGFTMGTLKVQVSTNAGTSWTDIGWSLTGQQPNRSYCCLGYGYDRFNSLRWTNH